MTSDRPTVDATVATPDSASTRRRVRVIYIVGAARSGSTLLSSLLGTLPGSLAVAEARLLWRNTAERRCGCGQPVDECPAWGTVLARARGRVGAPDAVEALQQRTIRDRHLPARLGGLRSPDARQYVRLLGTVYHTLAETTGADTIVDSSKSVSEAALLRHVDGIVPVIVHLVRDARAVAYSWQRAFRRREGTPPSALSMSKDWWVTNSAAEALLRAYPSSARIRLRYEDIVADPRGTLAEVAARGAPLLERDGSADVPGHMVGGNALRFEGDVPQLKLDVAWRTELGRRDARIVTAATFPLLLRYGYEVRPDPSPQG